MLLDAASEGLHVIIGMLIVGLIFLGVIIVGETFHWLGARRKTRRAARTQY
jgi:heme/copper-type cytochrome/quinol oxidase subunit 2